ncbi:MAG: glycosyltransferase [Nitrospira sp.]|nr:MAG: glycosyltransferase [Nitrospira sp.]
MAQPQMRVCHIVTGDGWGGLERVVSVLLEGMLQYSDLKINVVLFNHGQLTATLNELGIETHVIQEEGRSFLSLCRQLRSWLSDKSFDVIHVHRYNELAAAMVASVPRSPNLVLTVHGLQPWSQVELLLGVKCWALMFIARLFGAYFVAVSNEIEGRLCKVLGRSRTTRIVNPIPSVPKIDEGQNLRTILGWSATQRLVGFVGRLEFVKGPDLFLRIASMCSEEIGFVIIGGGSMEAELVACVQATDLKARVRFLGQVQDATPYLRQLDVLALTSRHEGLPMVVLEAASCGVPVVAFDVGGVGEVVDGGAAARLIRFGDFPGFVHALENVLSNDTAVRNGVLLWATSVRSTFSLQGVVKAYLAVYRAAARPGKCK